MRVYYEILNHLKKTFEEDERVNSVITGDFEQWKRDVFSLVHIQITDSPFLGNENTSMIRFNVDITVLDIRDVNKEEFKDKFWHNDNRHDIWNETFSILSLARNKLVKDHLQNDITISGASSATPVTYAYGNGLDGWTQSLTIDVPDNFTSVC